MSKAMSNVESAALSIITKLDDIARNYDVYEYGLPTSDDEAATDMRNTVVEILNELLDRQATETTAHNLKFNAIVDNPRVDGGWGDLSIGAMRQGAVEDMGW